MEASGRFGKSGPGRPGQMFSGRRGSLLVALIAAVIAGLLIYLFVSHYHKKNAAVAVQPTTATVFVATKYIPAGTPETQIIAQNLLKSEVVPSTQVIAGAISNPAVIAGEVASASIAAGQQVTLTDFTHTNVTISAYLTGAYRAVGLATDPVHNLTSYMGVGSKIDIVAGGKGGSVELFNNVTVLAVNAANYVVIRLTQRQVLNLTNAELAGSTIWFTLRPLSGATDPVPPNYVVKIVS